MEPGNKQRLLMEPDAFYEPKVEACLAYVRSGDIEGIYNQLQKIEFASFLGSAPNVELALNNLVYILSECAFVAIEAGVPSIHVTPLYRKYMRFQRMHVTIDDIQKSIVEMLVDFAGVVNKYHREPGNAFIFTVQQLLMAHLTDGSTVEDIAKQCNMSLSNLQHRYKKESGETLTQTIQRMRIEKACQLLDDGTLSCAEIASKLGFCSQSYFSKCFKAIVGVSPLRYRKE